MLEDFSFKANLLSGQTSTLPCPVSCKYFIIIRHVCFKLRNFVTKFLGYPVRGPLWWKLFGSGAINSDCYGLTNQLPQHTIMTSFNPPSDLKRGQQTQKTVLSTSVQNKPRQKLNHVFWLCDNEYSDVRAFSRRIIEWRRQLSRPP